MVSMPSHGDTHIRKLFVDGSHRSRGGLDGPGTGGLITRADLPWQTALPQEFPSFRAGEPDHPASDGVMRV